MNDCIFCKLVAGEVSTNKIYEDEKTFAFLDKHPINPGHILVVPKSHDPDFYDLDEDMYIALMRTVKKLSQKIKMTLEPKKVGLIVAGWDIPHTHVHIVPMTDYHDITSKSLMEGNRANPSQEELTKIGALLANSS
jgi:histidine triad (HIT) family protein